MEYLEITLSEYGLTFSTSLIYFNLGYLAIGLILTGLITYKVIKRIKAVK